MESLLCRELDQNGRLQIPELLLDRLGAEPDNWLSMEWIPETEGFLVRKVEAPSESARLVFDIKTRLPMLYTPTTQPKAHDVAAMIKESWEARSDKIAGLPNKE